MGGLGEVGFAHPDAEIDIPTGHGGEAVAVGGEIAGNQREQIGRLGERVVPLGPVGTALAVARRGAVAVGEQHREARFVGAHSHGVDRQDVGAIGVEADAAEALAFALGAEDPARGVEPHQLAVGGGVERDFGLDRRAVATKRDDQRRAIHHRLDRRAIDLEPGGGDPVAFEPERPAVRAVALDDQPGAHCRSVGVEVEVECDFGDEPVGRAVIAAAGFGVGGGGGRGTDIHGD